MLSTTLHHKNTYRALTEEHSAGPYGGFKMYGEIIRFTYQTRENSALENYKYQQLISDACFMSLDRP